MRFVIVTGMSGAGKSTALKMLEDRNVSWICADDPEFRNFNEESGIGSRCAKRTGYFWIRERP